MYTTSIISISVPQIAQVQGRTITCSNGCGVSIAGTILTLTKVVPDNGTLSFTFTLTNFKNVYNLGLTTSMIMSIYNSNGQLVDKTSTGITMSITGR